MLAQGSRVPKHTSSKLPDSANSADSACRRQHRPWQNLWTWKLLRRRPEACLSGEPWWQCWTFLWEVAVWCCRMLSACLAGCLCQCYWLWEFSWASPFGSWAFYLRCWTKKPTTWASRAPSVIGVGLVTWPLAPQEDYFSQDACSSTWQGVLWSWWASWSSSCPSCCPSTTWWQPSSPALQPFYSACCRKRPSLGWLSLAWLRSSF